MKRIVMILALLASLMVVPTVTMAQNWRSYVPGGYGPGYRYGSYYRGGYGYNPYYGGYYGAPYRNYYNGPYGYRYGNAPLLQFRLF